MEDTQALRVLRTHAKSFSWGGFFLPRPQLLQAAQLYQFCRICDDLADEASDPVLGLRALEQVNQALADPQPGDPDFVTEFRAMAQTCGLDLRFAHDLLSGLRQDLQGLQIDTLDELRRYCYRVAGTVGGMMSPILGVTDSKALPFAVDLGLAMQLTNICRDVAEDADKGRVYLPTELLAAHGICRADVLNYRQAAPDLQPVLHTLLSLADRYYQSGYAGMALIPSRTRFAILVAARVYQAIGAKIAAQGYQVLQGRVYLTRGEKVAEVLRAALTFWGSREPVGLMHSAELHQGLQGHCPCCHRLPTGSRR